MDRLKEYKIAFRGLGEGRHSFDFVLDEAFFDCFEATKGTLGKVDAEVVLVKSVLLMEVKMKIKGTVKATCDRCLGVIELPVEGEMNLYVKQSGREEGNEDDFIIIAPEDDFIDLSPYLYETYLLHYPMRVVHPDGECDEEMEQVLDEYVIDEDTKPTDPRWNELRKLINN
ncbi:MAG: DUF177 domain-containing protein [Odoribacter sp.]